MRRRSFLTLLGTAAAAWAPEARAQQDGRVRRVGILVGGSELDPLAKSYRVAFQETLAKVGWIEGRNLRTDIRFALGEPERIRSHAMELVSLAPEVIVTTNGAATKAVQRQTQTIPIVFTASGDPVSNGIVQNMARPEGNTTGLPNAFDSIGGKWLELLKEAAPHVQRVALVFQPETLLAGYVPPIEAAAPLLGVQTVRIPVGNPLEIVRAIDAFAAQPNGGLLAVPIPPIGTSLELMLRVVEQHRLPAIYPNRLNVIAGGLMTYTADFANLYRGAAAYVDRLLRGAKVSELPVQFPTRYELVVNLKTAKAIGLTIPESFLLRADEIIE
jgi:putative ABC transport system substrate-binding protein